MRHQESQSLREVVDREAIRNLPLRYCDCVWRKDVDGYLELFTSDGWVATADLNIQRAQGREGLRKMITEAFDTMKPRPFIHNHVFELIGPNRAKGRCYLEARLTHQGKRSLMTGYYDDEYVKVDGQWKFQSRNTTIDSFVPLKED